MDKLAVKTELRTDIRDQTHHDCRSLICSALDECRYIFLGSKMIQKYASF